MRSAVVMAVLAGLWSGAAAAQQKYADRIIPYSGRGVSGVKILSADFKTVTYVRFYGEPGPKREVAADTIKEISWGDAPPEVRIAVSEMNKGNYDKALERLDKAPASGPRAFYYEPYLRVLQGRCLMELNRPAEAAARFGAAVKAKKNSFYVLPAIRGKARAHMLLKEYEKAAEAYGQLDPNDHYRTLGATDPYGQLWQLRGRLGLAQAYARTAEKVRQAGETLKGLVTVCEEILAKQPEDLKAALPEVRTIHQTALVGRAEVLLAAGELGQAREWINSISGKISDKAARLSLYVTLGQVSMEAAKKALQANQKDTMKRRYKEALLAFMRVYILYPDQKAERIKAMMGAATASELLGSADDKRRAKRLYREVKEEFSNTPEAKEASQRLEALGG
jgi:tetratricopeptide (TPR) repeat protein